MKIGRIGYGIRGFYRIADYALRMETINAVAQTRAKILRFWKQFGLDATLAAFAVSRRTLYRWQELHQSQGGNLAALANQSRAPKQRRRRNWPNEVNAEIKRLRRAHPNLGRDKIHPLLSQFCQARKLPCPSVRTIGRLIGDAPGKLRSIPARLSARGKPKPLHKKVARKPKGYRANKVGECVALDTVERHQGGMRRYLITAIELHSRTGFALAFNRRNSRTAQVVLSLAHDLFPDKQIVLTDNGGEFKADFDRALEQAGLTHWHTYPKTPKMNAHCERFNRTVQEEFVDYHDDLLFTNLPCFNEKLLDWLTWYNCERPHASLGQVAPLNFAAQSLAQSNTQCHMYWPHTYNCISPPVLLFCVALVRQNLTGFMRKAPNDKRSMNKPHKNYKRFTQHFPEEE